MEPNSTEALPPGALPQDQSDSVDIKATPGEYIVPAEVVRFIGLDKLEKMTNKAKEQLSAMEETGRIGGEQETPEEPPTPEQSVAAAFAEGGVVTDGGGPTLPQDQGFTGVKKYTSGEQEVFIPFVNGEPLIDVPEGFSESTSAPGEASPPPTQSNTPTKENPLGSRSDARENDAFVDSQKRPDMETWAPQDFVQFGDRRNSVGDMAMRGIMSMIPGGGLVSTVARGITDRRAAGYIDSMLETGKDLKGNPLSGEQLKSLTETREGIKTSFASETGLSFSPVERLSDVLGRITDFATGGKPAPSTYHEAVAASGSAKSEPRSSVSPEAQQMLSNRSRQGDVSDRGNTAGGFGLGEDMGRDSSRGPSMGSISSGGLYKKGGLVAKRKK